MVVRYFKVWPIRLSCKWVIGPLPVEHLPPAQSPPEGSWIIHSPPLRLQPGERIRPEAVVICTVHPACVPLPPWGGCEPHWGLWSLQFGQSRWTLRSNSPSSAPCIWLGTAGLHDSVLLWRVHSVSLCRSVCSLDLIEGPFQELINDPTNQH